MSPEEKQLLGTVLLDELQMRAQQEPNLLVDVLLSESGYQFVVQTLRRRLAYSQQGVKVATGLLQSLQGQRLEPVEPEDKVA